MQYMLMFAKHISTKNTNTRFVTFHNSHSGNALTGTTSSTLHSTRPTTKIYTDCGSSACTRGTRPRCALALHQNRVALHQQHESRHQADRGHDPGKRAFRRRQIRIGRAVAFQHARHVRRNVNRVRAKHDQQRGGVTLTVFSGNHAEHVPNEYRNFRNFLEHYICRISKHSIIADTVHDDTTSPPPPLLRVYTQCDQFHDLLLFFFRVPR